MEAVIQISEVNSKDVNTSRGVSTVYNIKAQDGKEFSTFKKDLGQQAGQLRGQWATVEYTEVHKASKDGSKVFTNLYLDSVSPATKADLALNPVPGNSYAPVTEGLTTLPGPTVTAQQIAGHEAHSPGMDSLAVKAPGVTHNISYRDDKSAQINRSVAFKAAVELVGAGVLTIDGLEDLDKLTGKLIPIVDGTYVSGDAAPFETKSQSSGVDADLVKF